MMTWTLVILSLGVGYHATTVTGYVSETECKTAVAVLLTDWPIGTETRRSSDKVTAKCIPGPAK